jgi:uroporphyrinogen decarboxylase
VTPRERFLTAINNGKPDRVPLFDFLFQEPLYESLIGHKPGSYNGPDALELAIKLNMDAIWVPLAGFQGYSPEWIDDKTYKDEWGTVFTRSDVSWPIDSPISYPIQTADDFKKYVCPDPTLPGRDMELRQTIEMNRDSQLAITCGVQGPLTTAWLLMGFENISFALYDDPDLLESVFAMSNDFFKKAAKIAVECGVDGIWVSEDLGDSKSVFFRKDMYIEHFYPYLKDLVDYVDSLGVPALLHSCGNIYDYMDLLADTKIKSIHPLQRTAGMDLKRVKKEYGKRFCIVGNIDSSGTLPYGSAEDVRSEVRQAIADGAEGGGYILASDHSLHDGISVENIKAMFDEGLKVGSAVYKAAE